MTNLQTLINEYILDTENPVTNFNLALHYHNLNQTASAMSFYLRTAERTHDKLLSYSCLLGASICYSTQGCRNFTVKSLLRNALITLPDRPEAYIMLAQHHEHEARKTTNSDEAIKSWHDCYMISCLGERFGIDIRQPLYINIDIYKPYALTFERAVSSWWCGLCNESKNLFDELLKNYGDTMDEVYKNAVIGNINHLNSLKN